MLITVLDVTLVLGLLHTFPASCFINFFCAHVVWKIYRGQMIQSIWTFDGQDGWLVRTSCLGVGNRRNSPLTDNKYLLKHNCVTIIYVIYIKKLLFCIERKTSLEIWLVMSSYVNQTPNFSKNVVFATAFLFLCLCYGLQIFFIFESLKRYFKR